MWCFGADIRHPNGNLLLEFGFQRERPRKGLAAPQHTDLRTMVHIATSGGSRCYSLNKNLAHSSFDGMNGSLDGTLCN